MAIEHIYFRIPISVQTILPVITHDRVVAEDDLPLIILQFLIRLDPDKTAGIVVLILQEPVMVPLNQIEPPVQLPKQFVSFFHLSP